MGKPGQVVSADWRVAREECRRRQQPICIPRADAFDCRQAGERHGWPAASASFDPRPAAASGAAAFVAAAAEAVWRASKTFFVLFVEREFILLEFSVCSCGVSLVSLS